VAGVPLESMYLGHIEDSGGPIAALTMTPPHPLVIAAFDEEIAIAEQAIDLVSEHDLDISGVISTRQIADSFSARWLERFPSLVISHVVCERLYETREALEVPVRSGRLVTAGPEYFPLLVEWFRAFHQEALPREQARDYAQLVGLRIENGSIFIWEEHGIPLGMAGSARRTTNGICVNAVYTAPEYRGQGVGTSSVAALTRFLLRDHRFCVLLTDLSNPVSNSIYQRIGYRPVRDFSLIHFRSL
jgi:predicted GNAT family acetyltransferase